MDPFIVTYTGKKVNPLALKVEDIDILDIAHHLACCNRFCGALKIPVSVGQHSVYVSRLLRRTPWEREGLFHDASECYLGDISKWVKQSDTMIGYREAEDRAWKTIAEALALDFLETPEFNPRIKYADDLMVRYENMKLSGDPTIQQSLPSHPKPLEMEIELVGMWRPWS